jgi:predicted MFS family arabinose efflux permease
VNAVEVDRNQRRRVIVLLAGVEALANADQGTVGAVAPQLEQSLHITNGELGVIAAVAALAGAVGTIPVGMLTDRVNRLKLLWASIVLWCGAMVASAFAPSYLILVLTRVALGAVTATSGPTVASLTGDIFAPAERARVWGLILTGELVGSGIGVVGSGNLATLLSWRYGFAWLAIPGLVLALAIRTLLVEPERGLQSRAGAAGEALEAEQEVVQEVAREQHQRPHDELVLHEDPADMPLREAVRYILRVRTNVVLIVATALGYLFFAGVQTFAVLLLRTRYGVSQSLATLLLVLIGLGALAGVVLAGRIADELLWRGRISARVVVGGVCYLAAAAVFVPALASPVLFVSMPLFVLAGACLAAPDSPLNAARLDIMHPRLWGRAEGVRTVLFMSAFALAPLLFGFISDALGGPGSSAAAAGGHSAVVRSNALAYTFLIMLVPLALGGAAVLWAQRTYPRDVATAAASIEETC